MDNIIYRGKRVSRLFLRALVLGNLTKRLSLVGRTQGTISNFDWDNPLVDGGLNLYLMEANLTIDDVVIVQDCRQMFEVEGAELPKPQTFVYVLKERKH